MESKTLKDLKVGDEVYSILYGKGMIKSRSYGSREGHYIEVYHDIPFARLVKYTHDGKINHESITAVLFPHEVEVSITKTPEPVEKHVNIFEYNDGSILLENPESPFDHEHLKGSGKFYRATLNYIR